MSIKKLYSILKIVQLTLHGTRKIATGLIRAPPQGMATWDRDISQVTRLSELSEPVEHCLNDV